MEDIQCLIDLIKKRRNVDRQRTEKAELEQTAEYNNWMKTLQSLKDERMECIGNIHKNLNTLIAHKHVLHKIIYESDNITGLPITHGCQEQAIKLFFDMVEFINNLDQVYKALHKKNDIDCEKINENLISCINSIATELSKAKSSTIEVETLRKDIQILQEQKLKPDRDDAQFNGSLF